MIESEKVLERKLREEVKKLGGWCIKLLPFQTNGLPDRLCLLPEGVVFFAEIKTTFKKPSPIQRVIIKRLKKLGFNVYVIDNSVYLKEIIESYGTN